MALININVIQLTSINGEHSGLYMTTRNDTENFQDEFEEAFVRGSRHSEDDPDTWLETNRQIIRVYAEEVVINAD
jgi:hypothetical protein